MTKIVSFVNYKGGVGKTVTTVNMGAYLALNHNARVLIVDLDPQANATLYLMHEDVYGDWKKSMGTLKDIAESYLTSSSPPDIHQVIVKGVVQYDRNEFNRKVHAGEIVDEMPITYPPIHNKIAEKLDLLPGDLDLIDIDYRLKGIEGASFLVRELRKLEDVEYDFILCDCPPNLYIMTLNGLYASDSYVVPLIPDYISTIGLFELVDRIETRAKAVRKEIPCKGIIFTRVRSPETRTQQKRMNIIRGDPRLVKRSITCFTQPIHDYEDVRRALDLHLPICVYDYTTYGTSAREHRDLATEFLKRV